MLIPEVKEIDNTNNNNVTKPYKKYNYFVNNKPSKSSIANWIIITVLFLNIVLWLVSKFVYGDSFATWYKYIAKISSLTGTLMMAVTILTSIKNIYLEKMFGGLDKQYNIHRQYGKLSFVVLLFHPIFLGIHSLATGGINALMQFASLDVGSMYDQGRVLGYICFDVLVILIAISIYKKVEYQLWLLTHKLFVPLYILVLIHLYLVMGDIFKYPIFTIWYLTLSILPLLILLVNYISKAMHFHQFEGVVKSVGLHAGADVVRVEIELSSILDLRDFRAGQFAFFKFKGINNGWHPFSIALIEENRVILGIKNLGNYTSKVKDLSVGSKVSIDGYYGGLSNSIPKNKEIGRAHV